MANNKRMWWYVLGVLVVVILFVVLARQNAIAPSGYPTASPSASVSVSASPTPRHTVTPAPTAGIPVSYNEALVQYVNRRIQFDQYCQAIPSSTVFKNNTTIMLDNRSGDARTVAVGGTQYYLTGYGWRIVTLYSRTLPKTDYLDCGSARNVGTILIQP